MTPSKWSNITLELLTGDEARAAAKLHPTFDYTKLSAINMCPTWGIVRYTKHLAMPTQYRAMALEAGTVLHEAFSVVRLLQLGHHEGQGYMDHMNVHAVKLLGEDRWNAISATARSNDIHTAMRNAVMECIATSGFVDDPWDKRRTTANMELAMLYYVQRWDVARYPVWIADPANPYDRIGIEVPFAVKVTPHDDDYDRENAIIQAPFLYTGRIDGLHLDRSGDILIQENKSASRLDEAWRLSFDMSHQVTGYCVAASLFTGVDVRRGIVIGLQLPLPKTMTDGLDYVPVRREQHMLDGWLRWLEYTVTLHDEHRDDVHNAPRHTHSCNRYFRPCSLIPFCTADKDEQSDILDAMVVAEWSPLAEKAGD